MDNAQIEQELEDLEARMERLRALYEQYFLGLEKLEPTVLRKDVDRKLWVLRREKIRNTGMRFKFQGLVQRYNTYQQYWTRVVREIESGTYRRDILKVAQRFGEKEAITILGRKRAEQYKRLAQNQLDRRNKRKGQTEEEAAQPAPPAELDDAPIALGADDIELVDDDADPPTPPRILPPVRPAPPARPTGPAAKSTARETDPAAKSTAPEPDMEALLLAATVGVPTWNQRSKTAPPPPTSKRASTAPPRRPSTTPPRRPSTAPPAPPRRASTAPPAPPRRPSATPPAPPRRPSTAPPAPPRAAQPESAQLKTGRPAQPDSTQLKTGRPTQPDSTQLKTGRPTQPDSAQLKTGRPTQPDSAQLKTGKQSPPAPSAKSRVAELAAQMRAKKETAKPVTADLDLDNLFDAKPAGPSPAPSAPSATEKLSAPSASPDPAAPRPATASAAASAVATPLPRPAASAMATPQPKPAVPTTASPQPRPATTFTPSSPQPKPAPAFTASPPQPKPATAPVPNRAATPPAARPAPPSATASSPQRPPVSPPSRESLDDQRVREIYARYVGAKRAANESTAGLTFDKLAQSLRAQADKLRSTHPTRSVDFEVVVKDGKTALRPILK